MNVGIFWFNRKFKIDYIIDLTFLFALVVVKRLVGSIKMLREQGVSHRIKRRKVVRLLSTGRRVYRRIYGLPAVGQGFPVSDLVSDDIFRHRTRYF